METRRSNRAIKAWKRSIEFLRQLNLDQDQFFYQIGLNIGRNPWHWLIASLCVSCVCGSGMVFWREEVDDVELFIPLNSIVRLDATWVKNNFRDDLRYESIIVTAPNIFEPEVIHAIAEIEDSVKSIVVKNETWQDVCAGYLTWFQEHTSSMSKGDVEFAGEIIDKLNRTMVENECIYQSLLKLWKTKDSTILGNLTKDQVLDDVTRSLRDTTSNGNLLLEVAPLLANVEYNENGRVIGAQATILNWIMKRSNELLPEWELEFIDRVLNSNRTLPNGMQVYAVASRSFKDFLHEILDNNMIVLVCGLSLIAIYVMAMIGRFNAVQQRIYLSLMGVSVVGQAILSAYGVCYYLGYFYGPIHPILPFLLLGIGVDDMFVIIQSLENLSKIEKSNDIPLRVAKALEKFGLSITVTSFTNIVAFAIGLTTVMPFLKSFCLFATMGIFFLYIFEVTFFVSCLVLDERRLKLNKDGCCCRIKRNWEPNDCSQKNLQQMIFQKFIGPLIMKPGIKIFILFSTFFIVGVNLLGIFRLEQNFDPLWYLNQESYPIKFNDKLIEYFPKYGKRSAIYLAGIDYYEDRNALFELVETLHKNPYVNNRTMDPWFVAYDQWLNNSNYEVENKDEFLGYLSEYLLFTKQGQSYIKDIKFDKLPTENYSIPVSKIQFQHILINTTTDQSQAMHSIRDILKAVNFSRGFEHMAVHSNDYVSWSANEIIGEELIHNLILEILAVGLVTFLILRNFHASIWVMCCVLFTLIDLLGSMYYLGLTIEISSSIIILICAGLAVDYAAHIGLEFTRSTGTKNDRAIATLGLIGPAIFNGGLSTFLAFVLLGSSDAYLFCTFFKLFTAVVIFGLFHGLIFLPVILSILGPDEKTEIKEEKSANNCDVEENGFTTVHLPVICPDLIDKADFVNS